MNDISQVLNDREQDHASRIRTSRHCHFPRAEKGDDTVAGRIEVRLVARVHSQHGPPGHRLEPRAHLRVECRAAACNRVLPSIPGKPRFRCLRCTVAFDDGHTSMRACEAVECPSTRKSAAVDKHDVSLPCQALHEGEHSFVQHSLLRVVVPRTWVDVRPQLISRNAQDTRVVHRGDDTPNQVRLPHTGAAAEEYHTSSAGRLQPRLARLTRSMSPNLNLASPEQPRAEHGDSRRRRHRGCGCCSPSHDVLSADPRRHAGRSVPQCLFKKKRKNPRTNKFRGVFRLELECSGPTTPTV